MCWMKITGRGLLAGNTIEIAFTDSISSVAIAATQKDEYIAPGWIDLQVNGFAGVDYNHPGTSHAEIARSIHVLYRTGVTRFYPTVITGSPEDMESALLNLLEPFDRITFRQRVFGLREVSPRGFDILRGARDHGRIKARHTGAIKHMDGARDLRVRSSRMIVIDSREPIYLKIDPAGCDVFILLRGRNCHRRNRIGERNFDGVSGQKAPARDLHPTHPERDVLFTTLPHALDRKCKHPLRQKLVEKEYGNRRSVWISRAARAKKRESIKWLRSRGGKSRGR